MFWYVMYMRCGGAQLSIENTSQDMGGYFRLIYLTLNQNIRLFVLLLYVPVNSYGHVGRSVNLTTLFLGKLEQAVNQ